MKFYLDWASRIAAGTWTDGQAFYGLPGYAYWLAGLLLSTGGDRVLTSVSAGLLQSIAFGGVATLVYLFTNDAVRSLGRNASHAVLLGSLAAGAWVFFTPAQAYAVILMPTVGVVFAFWLGVRVVASASPETRLSTWLLLGLMVGVASLFIATIFFLLPLTAFGILRASSGLSRSLGRTRALAGLSLLLAGTLIGCSPAWLHNRLVAREPVLLSAHSGINMWIGNNPIANGYPKIPQGMRAGQEELLQDSLLIPQRELERSMKRSEISVYWSSRAKQWIRENPVTWLRLVVLKIANFWNAFQYDDINVLRLTSTDRITIGYSSFGVISALGLASLPLVMYRSSEGRWVAGAVLLHMAALVPVFVTERYRLAAVPGLIVCASIGLSIIHQAVTSKQWKTLGLMLSLALACAIFVSVPRNDPGAIALSHYNFGARLLAIAERAEAAEDTNTANREFLRAKDELEVAFRYAPWNTEINLALGNLWFARNDLGRAKLFYARVLALNRSHLSALNNLAVIAIENKSWSIARVYLGEALQVEPRSAKLYFLLSKAHSGAGDIERALESIEMAVAIAPGERLYQSFREELVGSSR